MDRASQLLQLVANGTPTEGHLAVVPRPGKPCARASGAARELDSRSGARQRSHRKCARALGSTARCRPRGGDGAATFTVTAPTWRPDIEREIDLIEEVAHGGSASTPFPRRVPASRNPTRGLSSEQRTRRLVQDTMVGCGLNEAITLPLINPEQRRAAGWVDDAVTVTNPLRSEESALRATLLPSLVDAAASNAAQGNPNCAFFELGHVFDVPTEVSAPLPNERVTSRGSVDRVGSQSTTRGLTGSSRRAMPLRCCAISCRRCVSRPLGSGERQRPWLRGERCGNRRRGRKRLRNRWRDRPRCIERYWCIGRRRRIRSGFHRPGISGAID